MHAKQGSEHLLRLLQCRTARPIQVRQVHALLITNGHLLFAANRWTSTLLFNALIRGYSSNGQGRKCLLLFAHMLARQAPPNDLTFASLAKAAVSSAASLGAALHAQVIRRGVSGDPFVRVSFIHFYGRIGELPSARRVFEEIPKPCVVACNAMLDAFGKSGGIDSAAWLFSRMPERDVVSWTSVINGLGNNGRFGDALEFFRNMMVHEDVKSGVVKPNEATYVSLLSSCANLPGGGARYYGKQIHGYIVKNEIGLAAFVGTALIDFYGKTSSLRNAIKVFNQMVVKEICTWNALISSLACNGEEKKALAMFEQMKMEGLCPSGVTFAAALTSCARGGFVESGFKLFRSMVDDFGLVPAMEHYGCMVDLLGRAGLLREAMEFVNSMPFEPDASVLGALLGACKIHGTIDLGNDVGRRLLEMQPRHCGRYVMLSNIHAELNKWTSAAELRKAMEVLKIQKVPAFSLIDSH
ncbi:hypothetical protein NL676_021687 [Syzygium grande]|nr:hypothetical protein NL676_021687 [Syzygium grande]